MSELDRLLEAMGSAGGDRAVMEDSATAHMAVVGHRIISMREVPGIEVRAEGSRKGIDADITVAPDVCIEKPIHLCFGVLGERGSQKINIRLRMGRGSSASFIAHCLFPNASRVRHVMDAVVELEDGASLNYTETHYHGPQGGAYVNPRARVRLGKGAVYRSDFNLCTGRVGRLEIDFDVDAGEDASAELITRVFGHKDDDIKIKEKSSLNGANSKSIIKTRVAIEDRARALVTGITEGNAPGARGHVDCMEIVKDSAVAEAVPVVNVRNPLAKVTHEAAIGSVDRRQMETLMAHGLTPEEAVDVIVKGILT